ncbi:MAG: hypothetical protein VB046_09770 [Paludibacter sp.]|nr:hypothetical protein [Paludibacter sp.]
MTELIINGTRAVLPEDINFTMFEESAYLTNNGEFTLDITLSLTNPVNRKIFKHRERLNVKTLIDEAQAVLIVDNKVSKGKITEIRNTDTEVSFQYVAGNSLVNNEVLNKKIWELNWGTESTIDFAKAKFTIEHPGYGEVIEGGSIIGFNKFVCTPVKFNNLIANKYIIADTSIGGPLPTITSVENIVMQPYLMYYIEKLPELLGYELTFNVLMSDVLAKKKFIANRINSLKYSDALPDISVFEFMDAIEEFYNVKFIFNKSKQCQIINITSYVENMGVEEVNDVLDSFEIEPDKEEINYDGIAYDLSGEGFNRYNKLDDEIVKSCSYEMWPDRATMIDILDPVFKNKFIIHVTTNNWRQFVYCDKLALNLNCVRIDADQYAYYVNRFRSHLMNQQGNYKELKITLLPFASEDLILTIMHGASYVYYYYTYQLPLINSTLFEPTQQLIADAIQNSVKQISRSNKLEVALFSGLVKLFYFDTTTHDEDYGDNVYYPISHTDNIPDFWIHSSLQLNFYADMIAEAFNTYQETVFKNTVENTLRIIESDGIENRYYSDVPVIDKRKIYVFKIIGNVSIDKMMHYNGSIYIPFSIEKTVDINGESEIKTAKFYKLK